MKLAIIFSFLLTLGGIGVSNAQNAASPTQDALLRASYVADALPMPRFETAVGSACADILMHAHRHCQPYPELPTAGMSPADLQRYQALKAQLTALRANPPTWESIVAQRSAPPSAPVAVERAQPVGGYAQRASGTFQGRQDSETSRHGDPAPLPANKPANGLGQ
jgi:hypothetical protein